DDNGDLYHVLTAEEQVLSDVASDREQRREQQGYVAPSQAASFLEASRRLSLAQQAAPPRDPIASGYFRDFERASSAAASKCVAPPFQGSDPRQPPERAVSEMASFLDMLREAGVIPDAPRALLDAPRLGSEQAHGGGARLSKIRTHMQRLAADESA